MRLICPNCGAQYAVDDRVIPEAGRDVQCSSCGNTWFQTHPDHDSELAEELGYGLPGSLTGTASEPPPPPRQARDGRESKEPAPEPKVEETSEPVPEPQVKSVPEPRDEVAPPPPAPEIEAEEPQPADAAEDDLETPVSAEEEMLGRRKIDDDVMSVLREEAEREQAARRAEGSLPEVQPELEMPAPPEEPHRGTADYVFAEPKPEKPEPAASARAEVEPGHHDFRPAPRRERLPDVEEITSTLEPVEGAAGEVDSATALAQQERKRGSRVGMGLAFLVFGALALVYARADRVAETVPQSAEHVATYVETIDSGRLWLDQTLREFVSGDSD